MPRGRRFLFRSLSLLEKNSSTQDLLAPRAVFSSLRASCRKAARLRYERVGRSGGEYQKRERVRVSERAKRTQSREMTWRGDWNKKARESKKRGACRDQKGVKQNACSPRMEGGLQSCGPGVCKGERLRKTARRRGPQARCCRHSGAYGKEDASRLALGVARRCPERVAPRRGSGTDALEHARSARE